MFSEIDKIEKTFATELQKTETLEQVESLRIRYLGRKGMINSLFTGLKNLPASEKQKVGGQLNRLKEKIEKTLSKISEELENKNLEKTLKKDLEGEEDWSLPALSFPMGKNHPIPKVMDEITEIFSSLGFSIAEGPEIETDENNFSSLNIPEEHPARDMHDTFYLQMPDARCQMPEKTQQESGVRYPASRLLLRTHTSPVQIRVMKNQPPPVRIIAPGKVYRHEAIDATHSSVFHQIEGLAVDENISFADLKATLEIFVKRFFGKEVKTRFRPSYFPFVEPGAEMDISCTLCLPPLPPLSFPPYEGGKERGQGEKERGLCSVCKGKGWLEMLGAGMVHPNVFRAVGYDADRVTGFAFGMGIERIAMIRYGITDMRLFYENHLDFLEQF